MEAIESKIMTGMQLPDPWLDRDLAHDIGGACGFKKGRRWYPQQ